MKPRGLTLVELLAAISILAVVTALAMPALQSRLGAARMEAAQGMVEAAVLSTRAEAIRAGKPLALEVRSTSRGELQLIVKQLAATESPLESGDERPASEHAAKGRADTREPESVWTVLPAGVTVSDRLPAADDSDQKPAQPATANEATSDDLRVALFCPDGSAIASGRVYLGNGVTTVAITVNPWIGGAIVTPVLQPGAQPDQTGEETAKSAPQSGKSGEDKR